MIHLFHIIFWNLVRQIGHNNKSRIIYLHVPMETTIKVARAFVSSTIFTNISFLFNFIYFQLQSWKTKWNDSNNFIVPYLICKRFRTTFARLEFHNWWELSCVATRIFSVRLLSTCSCVFKIITLDWSNQLNFF